MSANGSVAPSRQTPYARESVGLREAAFAVCVGIAFVAVSLPLPELLVVYLLPQLTLLALLSAALRALDAGVAGTRERAVVAAATALIFGVIGLVLMQVSGFHLLAAEWVLALPYAVGAGLACGTWVARPRTGFPRLFLRAFEAGTSLVVLYAIVGMSLALIRS